MGRSTRSPSQTVERLVERDVGPQHDDVLLGVLGQPGQQPVGGVDAVAARWQRGQQPPDAPLSGSTMTGMAYLPVNGGWATRPLWSRGVVDLAFSVSSAKATSPVAREDDLLGLLLGEGEGQQRARQLLGLLGAVLGRGRGRHRRGAADAEHGDAVRSEHRAFGGAPAGSAAR